jgi:hypothetical protein
MEESSAANRQRLESAQEELGNLKMFILSSASLQLATASNSVQAADQRKKKSSRRATCDPGAFSADLFRGGMGFGVGTGYKSGAALDIARDLFVEEAGNESELCESAAPAATGDLSAAAASMPADFTAAGSQQALDGSLFKLRPAAATIAKPVLDVIDLAVQAQSQSHTLQALEHEKRLKDAALSQLQISMQSQRCLAEEKAMLQEQIEAMKKEHVKAEQMRAQELTRTICMTALQTTIVLTVFVSPSQCCAFVSFVLSIPCAVLYFASCDCAPRR